MFLSLIFITFIGYIISYSLMSKPGNKLNLYSTKTYEHLNEIANNVIKEGVGIDLSAIADDVVNYEITGNNNRIIFKYYLDNNKDLEFAVSANMTIELSNEFNIISKKPDYSSEKEFVKRLNLSIKIASLSIGFLTSVIIMFVIIIGCTIGAYISRSHKRKNLS